ncbi:hypothetical protein PSAC2689_150028 [Paraburkholderia sacchari]
MRARAPTSCWWTPKRSHTRWSRGPCASWWWRTGASSRAAACLPDSLRKRIAELAEKYSAARTIDAAKALSLDAEIGSLEAGKLADGGRTNPDGRLPRVVGRRSGDSGGRSGRCGAHARAQRPASPAGYAGTLWRTSHY